ncbi:type II secretion system protein [Dechloromonas sp. HYN0024]|uniref:type II secretion system protein n=1 Tax=Dechloromonas sp. HYN0024 TaxID=2231055 RepID=UPI000E451477|nr:type II secretion system protein [Dechloromonas sp. HYN0024]AXS81039.1 type II secretion system protein [Dechloromonas sp. HYN0024]
MILRRRLSGGFTLIELLVTVALVGLIASMAFPFAELSVARARERDLRDALQQIRTGIDAYKQAFDEGRIQQKVGQTGYPPNLQVLEDGVDDVKNPTVGKKLYFLRRIPRDPFSSNPSQSAADTWGKRSYASSAKNPQEGEDVFDVYSKSKATGINGIPYRQW